MKSKHVILMVVAIALMSVCGISTIQNVRYRSEVLKVMAALKSLPPERLATATQTFSRDRGTNNGVLPMRDLVSGGHLRTEDVGILQDREVAVTVGGGDETHPDAVLVRVKLLTGRNDVALFGDGSIRAVPITK